VFMLTVMTINMHPIASAKKQSIHDLSS